MQAQLFEDASPVEEADKASSTAPDLRAYDRILVAFSGGKDSVACVLSLLDMGVDPHRIELHHHLVDGRESELMDWPITESYCRAFAHAFGMRISFSWRVGGFEREMLRHDAPTAPAAIPSGDGYRLIGGNGPRNTRLMFPQVSASLSVRWCSSYLKISLMDSWIVNDPQFREGKTLVITGERAQESASRAKYRQFEPHRADNRSGRRVRRWVDHWRPVHGWSEKQVWETIEQYRLVVHPAYFLGFGRCSCRGCVFGSKDQWATVKVIAPGQFRRIAAYEQRFGVTIHRTETVEQRACAGRPYVVDPFWARLGNSTVWDIPMFTDQWVLPAGAYGDSCGPT